MNGIEIDESIIYHGDYQIESGFLAAGELLDQGVTAIFACNDLMALGCIRKARQLGLTPGKEISVIGFDDITLCEFLDQPLTTVRQPLYEMGKFSFQLIKDLIDKPQSRIEKYHAASLCLCCAITTASPQKTQEQRAKPAI